MRIFIYIIIALSFASCGEDTVNKARELNKNNPNIKYKTDVTKESNLKKKIKIEKPVITQKERINSENNKYKLDLEKLKANNAESLAKIEAQKSKKLKEIELNKKIIEEKTALKKSEIESNKSIKIAKIKSQEAIEIKKEESLFYKIALIILFFILIFWIIFKYISLQSKKRQELVLKEKELNHQAYMEDLKSKHKHIDKMLDIISDEKSDKEIKKSMAKMLERGKNNLLT